MTSVVAAQMRSMSSCVFRVFRPESRAEECGFACCTAVLVSAGGGEVGEET